MDVKSRIDELRIKKGWSLSKLAKEAGISESTAYDWFNKNSFTPSRKTISLICEALEISLTEFYSEVDDKELKPKQILLLELFDALSDAQQDNVIEIIKHLK